MTDPEKQSDPLHVASIQTRTQNSQTHCTHQHIRISKHLINMIRLMIRAYCTEGLSGEIHRVLSHISA